MMNANFKDHISSMIDGPNPRNISNYVGALSGDIPLNPYGITVATTFWGQFMDHDLDFIKDGL